MHPSSDQRSSHQGSHHHHGFSRDRYEYQPGLRTDGSAPRDKERTWGSERRTHGRQNQPNRESRTHRDRDNDGSWRRGSTNTNTPAPPPPGQLFGKPSSGHQRGNGGGSTSRYTNSGGQFGSRGSGSSSRNTTSSQLGFGGNGGGLGQRPEDNRRNKWGTAEGTPSSSTTPDHPQTGFNSRIVIEYLHARHKAVAELVRNQNHQLKNATDAEKQRLTQPPSCNDESAFEELPLHGKVHHADFSKCWTNRPIMPAKEDFWLLIDAANARWMARMQEAAAQAELSSVSNAKPESTAAGKDAGGNDDEESGWRHVPERGRDSRKSGAGTNSGGQVSTSHSLEEASSSVSSHGHQTINCSRSRSASYESSITVDNTPLPPPPSDSVAPSASLLSRHPSLSTPALPPNPLPCGAGPGFTLSNNSAVIKEVRRPQSGIHQPGEGTHHLGEVQDSSTQSHSNRSKSQGGRHFIGPGESSREAAPAVPPVMVLTVLSPGGGAHPALSPAAGLSAGSEGGTASVAQPRAKSERETILKADDRGGTGEHELQLVLS